MGLLSVDISKINQLSLKNCKLPNPELRNIGPPVKEIEKPPSQETINYRQFFAINPSIEKFVNRFDLVSEITGEQFKIK